MLADLDKPKPAPKAAPVKPAAPPAGDVLDLTEAMAAPPPPTSPGPAPTFRTIDGDSDVVFTDRAAGRRRAREEPRRPLAQAPMPDPRLLSNTTAAAVDSAFNTLAAHRARAERAHA